MTNKELYIRIMNSNIGNEERETFRDRFYTFDTFHKTKSWVKLGAIAIPLLFIMLLGFSAVGKYYSVWAMEMGGKAKLAEATQSRQIQIEQAKGEKMAAEYTAEAIAIVGKAAKSFPEYRVQTFIQAFGEALNNGNIQKIIYVPTEANIPILEAGSNRGSE